MRKIITSFLTAFFLVALCASAQINNPKDAEGFYIVKWDCTNNAWAIANNFEVDETFTFAVDVTGTALETWLKETPTNAGATRSIAFNKWTGFGDVSGDSHRLKQIKGNIYGATWNFIQLATNLKIDEATATDAETFVYGTVFGYEYTSDNPGAAWWQGPIDVNPGTESGAVFKTLPYTGTKTSSEFYNDDYGNEMFGDHYPIKGYGPACAATSSVDESEADAAVVIGTELYNLQGARISAEPKDGAFVKVSILSNGTRVSEKVIGMQH